MKLAVSRRGDGSFDPNFGGDSYRGKDGGLDFFSEGGDDQEREEPSVPSPEVVAAGEETKSLISVPGIVDGRDTEPSILISKVMGTNQEIDFQLQFRKPFLLRWTFLVKRILDSLRLSPRF